MYFVNECNCADCTRLSWKLNSQSALNKGLLIHELLSIDRLSKRSDMIWASIFACVVGIFIGIVLMSNILGAIYE